MKLYTKTGDDGTTSLYGGKRIYKDHLRVEAYGTIDELNSFLGLFIDSNPELEIISFNQKIQHILFNIGSLVATTDEKMIAKLPQVNPQDIEELEKMIDRYELELPVMTNFILPSGHSQVSLAHVCRTVCRRAERAIVRLSHSESIHDQIKLSIQFLNRLSDYFFVLSRKLTQLNNANEVIWKKETHL